MKSPAVQSLLLSSVILFTLGAAANGHTPVAKSEAVDHIPESEHPAVQAKINAEGYAVYGAAMPAGDASGLALMLSKADASVGKDIKLQGRIGQVCQAAGCWLMLTDGEQMLRVKFGDHAFVVPKDASGEAIVFGNLEALTMSEAQAKHMAEDAGKDPSKVKGEQKEYRLLASAVLIKANP